MKLSENITLDVLQVFHLLPLQEQNSSVAWRPYLQIQVEILLLIKVPYPVSVLDGSEKCMGVEVCPVSYVLSSSSNPFTGYWRPHQSLPVPGGMDKFLYGFEPPCSF